MSSLMPQRCPIFRGFAMLDTVECNSTTLAKASSCLRCWGEPIS